MSFSILQNQSMIPCTVTVSSSFETDQTLPVQLLQYKLSERKRNFENTTKLWKTNQLVIMLVVKPFPDSLRQHSEYRNDAYMNAAIQMKELLFFL